MKRPIRPTSLTRRRPGLMRLSILLRVVLVSLGTSSSWGEDLEALIDKATANYPELRQIDAEVSAELARFDQVTTLPDPMASLSFSNWPIDTFSSSDTPMTGLQVMWSQRLPWPGKLRAQGEVVRAMADVVGSRRDVLRLTIRHGVQQAWYELYAVERTLDVLDRSEEVLTSLDEMAQAKYVVGNGLQADMLQVQVERTRLETRRTTLKQRRQMVLAELRQWVPNVADLNLSIPQTLALGDLNASWLSAETLVLESHPRLATLHLKEEAARRQREVARQSLKPDFEIQAGYRWRDDGLPGEMNDADLVTLGIGMRLPLFQKAERAAITEAEFRAEAIRHEQATTTQILVSQAESALAQLRRAKALLQQYENDLIPQARQSFNTTQGAYQAGKVEFRTLLQAELLLLTLEAEYHRLEADHELAVAQLELVTGKTVPELQRSRASIKEQTNEQ